MQGESQFEGNRRGFHKNQQFLKQNWMRKKRGIEAYFRIHMVIGNCCIIRNFDSNKDSNKIINVEILRMLIFFKYIMHAFLFWVLKSDV